MDVTMKTSHSHKQYLIEYLIAVALAALLATAHAQQVPLPTTAAEVPGAPRPVPR